MQPRQRPFDIPALFAQATAVCRTALGQYRRDAVCTQPLALGFGVVPTIPLDPRGAKAGATPRASYQRDSVDQSLQLCHIVDIGRRDLRGQRNALRIRYHVMLGARFGAIRRIGAGLGPPKTARTDELSTSARDQSILCSACRSESKTWCRSAHTPAVCQSRRRRQHVMPEPQPISGGKSSQAIPVLRTKRMPVKALRLSMGLRPGKRVRRGLAGGKSGCTISHNSSETSGLAIRACLSQGARILLIGQLDKEPYSFC